MPLFEIGQSGLRSHEVSEFADLGIRERDDLQRLIRDQIEVLDDDLLVVAEEFGSWEDARRRVDLLAIDRQARLVVIELKRTEDGGHMDLQALRYAAMVSSMVFDDVVRAHQAFLEAESPARVANAREGLLSFLDFGEEEPTLSTEVAVILVSRDFGREITTTALWLNSFEGMDVRCVRVLPYEVEDKVLLDIQQVVPLPETADYQVRLRRKDQERERSNADGRDWTRYRILVDGNPSQPMRKRQAIRTMVTELIDRDCDAERILEILGPRKFLGVEGTFTAHDQLVEALEDAYHGRFNPNAWFLDDPISWHGKTYVVRKNWAMDTEPALEKLQAAFPESGVTFSRATD